MKNRQNNENIFTHEMKLRLNWLCLQDPDVSVRGDDLQLPGEVCREAAELPAHLVHIQRRHQQLLPGNI